MMIIEQRALVRFLVLLIIILPAIVLQSLAKEGLYSLQEKKELLSQENHYVQNVFFAARNCNSYEQCEDEVGKLKTDPKCPKEALQDAHMLSMAMGNERADRRIVRMIEKEERPWTHDNRSSQAKLFLLSVGTTLGLVTGVVYGDEIKGVGTAIFARVSLDMILEILKKLKP